MAAGLAQVAVYLLSGGPPTWLAAMAGLQVVVVAAAVTGPLRVLDRMPADHADATHAGAAARAPTRLLVAGVVAAIGGCVMLLVAAPAAPAIPAAAGALLASLLSYYLTDGYLLAAARHQVARRGLVSPDLMPLAVKLYATATSVAVVAFVLGQTLPGPTPRTAPAPVIGAALVLLGLAVLVFLAARDLRLPLRQLRRSLDTMAHGDLRPRGWSPTTKELGRLATSLRGVSRTLTGLVSESRELAQSSSAGSAATHTATQTVLVAVREHVAAMQHLGVLARTLGERGQSSRGSAERLVDNTRRTRELLSQGETSLAEALTQATALRRSGEAAGVEASALTREIGTTTTGLAELGERASEIAAATTTMDAGVARARTAAADTADLSSQVSNAAEKGYRAVHHTLDAIERIRELSQAAHTTIDSLGARLAGIGQIVSVIEEIAQKTNLLALNASIIAAQAGQHGRGMAVVAGEIKSLAQRTAASTKEIAEQITGIQSESVHAMDTMAQGVGAVDNGFQVAVSAGDALGEIRQIARAAQKKVQGIARVMDDHAGASRRTAEMTSDFASQTREYAGAVQEQLRTGESMGVLARDILEALDRFEARLKKGAELRTLGAVQAETTIASADDLRDQERVWLVEVEEFQAAALALSERDADLEERLQALATANERLDHDLRQLTARLENLKA